MNIFNQKWTPSLGQFFLILRCERSGVHYPTSFLIDSLKYTSSGVKPLAYSVALVKLEFKMILLEDIDPGAKYG
jgi:hypothetical protein